MDNLVIERGKEIPSVLFNLETGVGSIEGECFDVGIMSVFEEIEHWLRDYATLGKPFTLLVNVSYYNTSASKCFADLFALIEKININADKAWAVTIEIADQENYDEDKEAWSDMVPEFPTVKFQIV
jgi:hypothetical protein